MAHRLHILGPAGSGTTTLAAMLSQRLGMKHLDTDDFYWAKTQVPFTKKIPERQRVKNIEAAVQDVDGWILSGSICSWGEPLIHYFTQVIYLWVPWATRKQRLENRERERYGLEALAIGGDMYDVNNAFMTWASKYDTAGMEQRSRISHESWLAELPECLPIIRIEEEMELPLLVDQVVAALA